MSGKLFACGVVLGIEGVLVIITQSYQLDADSVWFFRRLIFFPLPIIILSRFLPLWSIWVFLFNFYLSGEILYSNLSFIKYIDEPELFFSVVFLITIVSLFELLWAVTKNNSSWDWIRVRWFRFLLMLYAINPIVVYTIVTYGEFLGARDSNLDLIVMGVGFLFVLMGIFYFSKIATDLWSLSLLVLGLDVIILICAMITFDFMGVPHEGMPVIGLILSILIFWGSYVLLNRFRISLRVSKLAEEKEAGS